MYRIPIFRGTAHGGGDIMSAEDDCWQYEQEDAYEQACEDFVFQVLTDAPDDWILWALDRVEPDERVRLVDQIRTVIDPSEYTAAQDDLVVLRKLSSYHRAVLHSELAKALQKDGTPLSPRTIGKIMRRLHAAEMIRYPHGPHKGARVTPKGEALLRKNPPV